MCTAIEDGKGCAKFGPYSGTKAAAQGHGTQLDVPFSIVADTLLLPISIPRALFGSNSSTSKPATDQSDTEQKMQIK